MALSLGSLLNGLRLRHRLSGLRALERIGPAPSNPEKETPEADDFLIVHAPAVDVDDATRAAAIAYARAEGLDVLDLVPGDLPLDRVLELAQAVDTTTFRSAPMAAGRGALHALLVHRDVWDRLAPSTGAGEGEEEAATVAVPDRAALVRLTQRLKLHAARSTDLAVASHLRAADVSLDEQLSQRDAMYGGAVPVVLAIPAARSSLLVAGLALSPGWGAAAVVSCLVQPYLVAARSAVHPRPSSPLGGAIKGIIGPFLLVRTAMAGTRARDSADKDPVEALRADYTAELAQGTQRFFEPRRATCPWCGGTELVERFRTPDLIQYKPGEFVIDECTSCKLLFQNPRLSIDGLDFYYRDFYDGLSEDKMQFVFGQSGSLYPPRVDLGRRHVTPHAWLDVGTGYGNFCLIARGLLPATRFDGLDMGSSIEEGQRRGWVDHGYRGLFPDMADELHGRYDMISMFHYLEHTRDPRAELDAAHAALEPGGYLLIEVPDPESHFGRLLGRYWFPWLQPQHQQFVPVANLCSALEDRGFSVVEVERCPADPVSDVGGALWMFAGALAPPPRRPWGDDPTAAEQFRRVVILGAATPVAVICGLVGHLFGAVIKIRARGWANAYRVLARRV